MGFYAEHERESLSIKTNLHDSECLIIALTALNSNGAKENSFDFSSFAENDEFSCVLIKDLDNNWYTKGIRGVGRTHEADRKSVV